MNKKGYTLIECLISLLIISISVFLIINLSKIVLINSKNNDSYTLYLNSINIKKECAIYRYISVSKNQLAVTKLNNDIIIFYISNNTITRTVNNEGYVLIHKGDKNISFKLNNKDIYFSNGDHDVKICKQ